MKKNVIFYNVATVNHYQKISDQIFNRIESSGLLNNVESINININGSGSLIVPDNDKYNIYRVGKLEDMEHHSMLTIREFSILHDNYNIFYLHSAGCSHPESKPLNDRREYLLYFNVDEWQDAVDKLNTFDCYGCDLRTEPVMHYSSNFWWATTEYLRTLPKVTDLPLQNGSVNSDRHRSEFWVCYGNAGNYYCAWDCGISCYERHLHSYSRENYVL